MNEHEKDRIAAAFHQLRPDWPAKSLRTLLDRDTLTNRPRRDVVVALGWVACETATAKPARVLEAGPWWRAAAVDGATNPHTRDVAPVRSRCTTCGRREGDCPADHEFTPWRPRETDLAEVVAEVKAHIHPTVPSQEEASA